MRVLNYVDGLLYQLRNRLPAWQARLFGGEGEAEGAEVIAQG